MPFVAEPNIVQVELRALLDGQKIENRWKFDCLTTPTPTIVAEVTNLVSIWAQERYFPLLPNAVTLTEVFGRDMTTIDGSQDTIVPEGVVTGGQAVPPMPNEVTFCVSLRSQFAGRSARGRSYMLAIPNSLVTGNHLNSTLRGQFVSAMQELISRMTTAGRPLVIVSHRSNGAVRPGGPVYFVVQTAVSVDDIVDSQRRRKPGNGS